MINGSEVKVLDINSEFYGVPTIYLMENAGRNVANFVMEKLKPKNILIFCGTGNNGGDGFVTARYLSKKYNVSVFLTGTKKDIKTSISQKNFSKLKNTKIYDIASQQAVSPDREIYGGWGGSVCQHGIDYKYTCPKCDRLLRRYVQKRNLI